MNKNFSTHYFETTKRTKIGNDVWIGNNCLIKNGITIGDGAIIGMGSVITKDVEPYMIVAGNPGKIIRKRFDDETIEFLINTKWWELNDDDLAQKAYYFNDINKFISI
jgi:acetyltransferase-like isoleucine patch superfamily enzyme